MATVRVSVSDEVEVFDLRHYASSQLRSLLTLEAEHWAASMNWDYSSSMEMVLRYVDSKILPGYAATENGRVIGYSFFVYEGSKGVIGDLFVASGDPRRDSAIRSQLLEHVIETVQETPGIHRIEAQLLVHDTGVVATPFLREGFQIHQRVFMSLPLSSALSSRIEASSAVELRRWREGDFQLAASVITAAYAGHIDSFINDQYRSVQGSLRFLNNIVRFPGCGIFDPEASLVAVSRTTGAMVGLILCSRIKKDVGHVTQICLLPQYRGRGIGEHLVMAACQEMRKRNFTELSLTVTHANTAAVQLYRKLGFTTKRVFDAFVWDEAR
jgi:ribosomal protein S18 acetylase RimI-like enzyme